MSPAPKWRRALWEGLFEKAQERLLDFVDMVRFEPDFDSPTEHDVAVLVKKSRVNECGSGRFNNRLLFLDWYDESTVFVIEWTEF
jgi:hypothetical protein